MKAFYKKNKEFKCEWLSLVYCAFLPADQVQLYCKIQQKHMISKQVIKANKVRVMRKFIKYHRDNYTKENSRYAKQLWNLFSRAKHLNFTNNLTEIMNRMWKSLVGSTANIWDIIQALAAFDAESTVDFECMKTQYKHSPEDGYPHIFNKKSQTTIDRDKNIVKLMTDYFTYIQKNEFNFDHAKVYIKNVIDTMKPYLKQHEVTFENNQKIYTEATTSEQKNDINEDYIDPIFLESNIDLNCDTTYDSLLNDQIQSVAAPVPTVHTNITSSDQKHTQQSFTSTQKKILTKYTLSTTTECKVQTALEKFVIESDCEGPEQHAIATFTDIIKNCDQIHKLNQQYTKFFKCKNQTKINNMHLQHWTDEIKYLPVKTFIMFKVGSWWHPAMTAIVESDYIEMIFFAHKKPWRYIDYNALSKTNNCRERIKLL